MTNEEKQTANAQIISDLMLEHLHAIRLDVFNMRRARLRPKAIEAES